MRDAETVRDCSPTARQRSASSSSRSARLRPARIGSVERENWSAAETLLEAAAAWVDAAVAAGRRGAGAAVCAEYEAEATTGRGLADDEEDVKFMSAR